MANHVEGDLPVAGLDAEQLDDLLDQYEGAEIVREALSGGSRFPIMGKAIRREIEARARELADADRIEAEIERRAEERARDLYEARAFRLTPETPETPASGPEAVREPEKAASGDPAPPGIDLSRGWPEAPRRQDGTRRLGDRRR